MVQETSAADQHPRRRQIRDLAPPRQGATRHAEPLRHRRNREASVAIAKRELRQTLRPGRQACSAQRTQRSSRRRSQRPHPDALGQRSPVPRRLQNEEPIETSPRIAHHLRGEVAIQPVTEIHDELRILGPEPPECTERRGAVRCARTKKEDSAARKERRLVVQHADLRGPERTTQVAADRVASGVDKNFNERAPSPPQIIAVHRPSHHRRLLSMRQGPALPGRALDTDPNTMRSTHLRVKVGAVPAVSNGRPTRMPRHESLQQGTRLPDQRVSPACARPS